MPPREIVSAASFWWAPEHLPENVAYSPERSARAVIETGLLPADGTSAEDVD